MEGLAENRFDVERGNEHRIRKGGSCEKEENKVDRWAAGTVPDGRAGSDSNGPGGK